MSPFPAASFVLSLTAALAGSDWPQFRGPDTTGVVPGGSLPAQWNESEHVAWRVRLGSGWSQPVVLGGKVFVTEAAGEGLEAPMGMQAGVADPRTMEPGQAPDVEIDFRLRAFDLASGKDLWSASVAKEKPRHAIHPSNTYASETPAVDGDGVYAFFGMTGTLAAFDHAGQERWRVDLGTYSMFQEYGTAASPALYAGKLFVQYFNQERSFLVALDTANGKELWRVERETPATSWSSPLVWRNGKRTEIVVSGGQLITSHDPASGAELWRVSGVEGPGLCSFAADAERIYFGQKSPMASPPLYALVAGASGDLSPTEESKEVKGQAWSQNGASPGMPSPVAAGGLLYVASENVLACRDAATGEQVYKERVPGLVTIGASPIVVGDRLLLLDEEGQAAFVPLGREFHPASAGKLAGLFWSTPTVADDALLLRSGDTLYCLRE